MSKLQKNLSRLEIKLSGRRLRVTKITHGRIPNGEGNPKEVFTKDQVHNGPSSTVVESKRQTAETKGGNGHPGPKEGE